MKKSLVLLLALILFATGTIYYAQNTLLEQKDQVHLEERVELGDKSVIEGVTVELDMMYQQNLFWKTTYVAGANPTEATEYRFYPWYHEDQNTSFDGSLYFVNDITNLAFGNYIDEEAAYTGINAAMKELYDETKPGEKKSMDVYLKDYADYYTWTLYLILPTNAGATSGGYEDFSYLSLDELKKEIADYEKSDPDSKRLQKMKQLLADTQAFNEFFKIPVLENELHSIAIEKDAEGDIIGMSHANVYGGSSTGSLDISTSPELEAQDSYSMDVYSSFYDGSCYMTFDPRTFQGNLVDISQIPGGYGIYHFTYDSEKGTIDLSQLKLVYALDATAEIYDMETDPSGRNLILATIEGDRSYMTIIDRKTMTAVEKVDIGSAADSPGTIVYEDFIVLRGEKLEVYELEESGTYSKKISVELEPFYDIIEDENGIDAGHVSLLLSFVKDFDWNGETLVFTGFRNYEEVNYYSKCDFYIAAVDESGLCFYAEYDASLSTKDMDRYLLNRCRANTGVDEMLQIHLP